MNQLIGHSITYRIAIGPQAGRKVFTPQTLPACDEPYDDRVGRWPGFLCMPGWQRVQMNARNWNGCAATSAGQRCRKSAFHSRRMATFART